MKKLMVVVIMVLLIGGNLSYARIHNDSSLSIEFPDEYVLTGINIPVYCKGTDEFPKVILNVQYNTERKVNIKDISYDEIREGFEEGCKYIETEFGNAVTLLDYKKTKIAKYDAFMGMCKMEGLNVYYELYTIFSDNYVYSIGFSSNDSSWFETVEYNNIKNSLVIKDKISDYSLGIDIGQALKSGLKLTLIVGIILFARDIYNKIKKI